MDLKELIDTIIIFLILMFVAVFALSAKADCPSNAPQGDVKKLQALFAKHNSPRAVLPSQLAPAVLKASAKYCVNPDVIAAVIIVESKGIEYAYNEITGDYGLLQINWLTADNLKISMGCRYDWRCNLDMGVKILSQFERICQYNVGTGKLIGNKLKRCKLYEQKLAGIT